MRGHAEGKTYKTKFRIVVFIIIYMINLNIKDLNLQALVFFLIIIMYGLNLVLSRT